MKDMTAGPGLIAAGVLAVLVFVGVLAWTFLKPQGGALKAAEQQAVDQNVEAEYEKYFKSGGAPGGPQGAMPGGPPGGMPGGPPGGMAGAPAGGMPGAAGP